jgi:CubicO group peptidase (beta-lactamase class C family)
MLPRMRPAAPTVAVCRGVLALCLLHAVACAPKAATRPPSAPSVSDEPVRPSEPPAPRVPDDLAPLLEPIMERMQVPGLAAAIVDREGLVAIGAVGRRRSDDPAPLRTDDRFHLGSDTKAMTAYVVGRLVDRGALAWDDTLGSIHADAETWMHEQYRTVTVDELLVHRSGLPANAEWEALEQRLDPASTPAEQRAIIARFALAEPPTQDRGTFLYSNLGYIVLGATLHRRTGSTWEDLMRTELFEPLGMTSCGFGPVATAAAPDGSWAHEREADAYRPVELDNPAYLGPAGTVHCTLEDWGRFARAMFAGAPGLERATLEHLRTPSAEGYARGWLVSNAFPLSETVITHDGSNTVNYASIVIAPHRGLALMTACNAGDAAAQGAAVDAMLTLMQRYGAVACSKTSSGCQGMIDH